MSEITDHLELVERSHPLSNLRISYNAGEDQPVYVDDLDNIVLAKPNENGNNLYTVVNKKANWVQEVKFQDGSPSDGVNGVTNEALIAMLAHRLTHQNKSYPSMFNDLAITLLEFASSSLNQRVDTRRAFDIYDTEHTQPSDELKAANMRLVELLKVQHMVNTMLVSLDPLVITDADLNPIVEIKKFADAGDKEYVDHMAAIAELMGIYATTSVAAGLSNIVTNANTIREQYAQDLIPDVQVEPETE